MQAQELNPQQFGKSIEAMHQGLQDGIATAMSLAWMDLRDRRQFGYFSGGRISTEADSRAVDLETVYDLASLTKIFCTAPLIWNAIERQWLSLNDEVGKFFPSACEPQLQIHQLLNHTSGWPAWNEFYKKITAQFGDQAPTTSVERMTTLQSMVTQTPLENPTGTKIVYSDLGFLMLGWITEKIFDDSLQSAFDRLIGRECGLKFMPIASAPQFDPNLNWAATEKCPWRLPEGVAALQGQVHDDNCWSVGGVAGHAGLFGDLTSVCRAIAFYYDHWVGPSTRDQVFAESASIDGQRRTLGWDMRSQDSPSCGTRMGLKTFGHLGFTGTSVWIDPEQSLAIVLLTNRVHPSRENIKIRKFRPLIHEALVDEILKAR